MTVETRRRAPVGALVVALRIVTAALLAAIAGIHLDLWASHGYQHIPTIGPLFLVNVIAGFVLALACLVTPRRLLALVAAASVLFAAGTLGALLISINVGLFGFTESSSAPLVNQAMAVEVATI
ncbi:MAG TPA: hypothetical protein VKU91_09485, partial [Acidimicrobiales bacterium]|nr:hypothetical protein [Acidimicrobiales bacterium]